MSTDKGNTATRDSLGDRMRGYEAVSRSRLTPKMPVMTRFDGKAFHTLTRGMEKPVDWAFVRCMHAAARALCESVQGCKLAYVQSDEITLLLVDYEDNKTQPWFDYEVQKMCSISAATASVAFARTFQLEFPGRNAQPVFDARFWNLPLHEVSNAFLWRQQDATRNSISGLAQACFSHRDVHGKDSREMQDMLHGKGINWNDCPTVQKRGACLVREVYEAPGGECCGLGDAVLRSRWVVDEEIPVFTQDRQYIDRHVYVGEAAVHAIGAEPISEGRKESSTSLIEDDGGRILCVWHRKYAGWVLPGGKVEPGESPSAAQARELREETDLGTVTSVLVYSAASATDEDRTVHTFSVIASGTARGAEPGTEVAWKTRAELLAESPFRAYYAGLFAALDARGIPVRPSHVGIEGRGS